MTREQLAQVWPQLLERGVQWRDGMAGTFAPRGNTWRAVNCRGDTWSYQFSWSTARRARAADQRDALPDLEDPATVGCLLAELRRIGESGAIPAPLGSTGWYLRDVILGISVRGATEGEVLVKALCTALKVERPD